jgi:hypothetical protein
MSAKKKPVVEGEELSAIAREILIHTGVATYCMDHNYLKWENDRDAEQFSYALGANMVRRGQIRCDPAALMRAITEEIRDLAENCPDCLEH